MANFFRISARCHDGLLFMSQLSVRTAPLTIEEAAGRFSSPGYLEQIVAPLRAAGLVSGKRGPGGGYVLARAPEKITVREVVEALEGRITLVACQEGACSRDQVCSSKEIWNTLQTTISQALEGVTLAAIAEQGTRNTDQGSRNKENKIRKNSSVIPVPCSRSYDLS